MASNQKANCVLHCAKGDKGNRSIRCPVTKMAGVHGGDLGDSHWVQRTRLPRSGGVQLKLRIHWVRINTLGSTNDRMAWAKIESGEKVSKLPEDSCLVRDVAYPASDGLLTPCPGAILRHGTDAFNFFQSQA
ncbi:unnamed protein product [Discosporangium mesarthrocarpum]